MFTMLSNSPATTIWEFTKIRGTLFWGPYKDPTDLLFRVLSWGPLFSETPVSALSETGSLRPSPRIVIPLYVFEFKERGYVHLIP